MRLALSAISRRLARAIDSACVAVFVEMCDPQPQGWFPDASARSPCDDLARASAPVLRFSYSVAIAIDFCPTQRADGRGGTRNA
jgi:hypothetical protein